MYWKKARPLSGPKWEKLDKVEMNYIKKVSGLLVFESAIPRKMKDQNRERAGPVLCHWKNLGVVQNGSSWR